VESGSALIEREDGIVEMVNYHPFSAARTALKRITEPASQEEPSLFA